MKEARNLVDLEPVNTVEVTDDEIFASAPTMTSEQLMESLARSREDIEAGRVHDAREHLNELMEKARNRNHVSHL